MANKRGKRDGGNTDIGCTVVSNYRFYQVGLFWHCQTLKVHYFILFNARTKTKLEKKKYTFENFI